ncbi:FAD-dependent oxidoreductase [Amycolatopsis rhabdoformis]|uniref:FAD-dependent oxidoreductase n=1 Tax=Amycolatopsis rhabdoformis TaxID=1448059 RepID=A0ABZ1IL21_9PSEU|nr:FAD-dependent oxidoreductase [Amycolatopsis rhabdoformis]WSE34488.1 FAD-dependent oxidoreductase [Amycolatopsis rhabdoformis]
MTTRERAAGDPGVVVVGAGYAGLTTASRLADAGVDVVVLEAGDRVGGRVVSELTGSGVRVDHGGQWIGPTQRRFHALAARFGCATFPTWETGRHVEVWHDGTAVDYAGAAPDDGPGIAEYERVTALLDELASRVDLDRPWRTPRFEEFDARSAEEFFRAQTSDEDALVRLALAIQGVWCAEPREISLFHVLFYLASAGGYEQLMETRGCAQDARFTDGADAVARAMAAALGDRVRLGDPVRSIRQTADGVEVTTGRTVVRAARVVVAVPPATLERITFDPALPADRLGWARHSPMGRVAKVHAVYDTPFWRAHGRSGIATLYGESPVGVVFDNSPEDASRGVLVAFVYGDRLDRWAALDDAARREAVVSALSEVAGAEAKEPVEYLEKIWPHEGWTVGGYECFVKPGGWTAHGRDGWRAPAGRVHWAGTETASVWNGYIDGAISSGERAAGEVISALDAVEQRG